ncbi:hypothetical protein HA466_0182680 [Hirschfeldia incana]|nr:hypothetical protein HA466_0182680 [Hirschfeldia incana]
MGSLNSHTTGKSQKSLSIKHQLYLWLICSLFVPALTIGSTSIDSDDDGEDEDDDVCDWGFVVRKKSRVDEAYPSGGEGSSCRELARVILKLGEVYEMIEGTKQRVMVELEKQRMEAAKEIELQRMNILMDMQIELERSKLAKRRAAASAK